MLEKSRYRRAAQLAVSNHLPKSIITRPFPPQCCRCLFLSFIAVFPSRILFDQNIVIQDCAAPTVAALRRSFSTRVLRRITRRRTRLIDTSPRQRQVLAGPASTPEATIAPCRATPRRLVGNQIQRALRRTADYEPPGCRGRGAAAIPSCTLSICIFPDDWSFEALRDRLLTLRLYRL